MIYTQQQHWHHLLIYVAFFPIFCFSYPAASGTASPISQGICYSSSSAIPVMVNHVCTYELSADLGRSFSKRKNYGGNFHSWSSHLTSSQHRSCLTLRGFSWKRCFGLGMSDTSKSLWLFLEEATPGSKVLWFSDFYRKNCTVPASYQSVGFIISLIPVSHMNTSQLHSMSHCTSQHCPIFTKCQTNQSTGGEYLQ